MRDYRKVFRSQIRLRCQNCDHIFVLNDNFIAEKERRDGFVPLKARSSSTSISCPECSSLNFNAFFDYKNLYRRRCPKCGVMFETEESWKYKCDTCAREHAELMASMGPG